MPRGGARNGAGRPKGAHGKINAEDALRYASEGLMPVDFFLGEMRRLVAEGKPKEAFPYAREAAPYCHRKLASLTTEEKPAAPLHLVEILEVVDGSDGGPAEADSPPENPPGPARLPA